MKRRELLAGAAVASAAALSGCMSTLTSCQPAYRWDADLDGSMTGLYSAVVVIDGTFHNRGGCTISAAKMTFSLVDPSGEVLSSGSTMIRDVPGGESTRFTVSVEVESWMADAAAEDPWETDVEFIDEFPIQSLGSNGEGFVKW